MTARTDRRRRPSMAPAFRWVVAHPLWTIFVIAVLTVGSAAMIPRLRVDTDFSNYLNRTDPAVMAANEAKDRYGSQIMLMVIVEAPSGIFDPEALELLEGLGAALAKIPVIAEITGPFDSQVIRGTETSIQIRPVAPRGEAPITPEEIATYREDVLSERTTRDFVVSSGEKAAAFYVRAATGVEMVRFAEAVEGVVGQFERDGVSLSIAGVPYKQGVRSSFLVSVGVDCHYGTATEDRIRRSCLPHHEPWECP